jgi:hypothetical protein
MVGSQAGTDFEKQSEIATKFTNRARALATDGYIAYDIQPEDGRWVVEMKIENRISCTHMPPPPTLFFPCFSAPHPPTQPN